MKIMLQIVIAAALFLAPAFLSSPVSAQDIEHHIFMVLDRSEVTTRLLEAETNPSSARTWSDAAVDHRVHTHLYRASRLPRAFRQAHIVVMDSDAHILFEGPSSGITNALTQLYESSSQRFGCSDFGVLTQRLVASINRETSPDDSVHVFYVTPGISSPQSLCVREGSDNVQPISLPQPINSWGLGELIALPQLRTLHFNGVHDDQVFEILEEAEAHQATRRDRDTFSLEVRSAQMTDVWLLDANTPLFEED